MKFRHVLVVTYGRSGSTLLQGLLNSIDGCLVRGENFNACRGLFMAYDAFRQAREENGQRSHSSEPTSPWFGAFLLDEQRFLSDARRLLLSQLAPGELAEQFDCIGFKEVRYLGDIWPRTDEAAEELTAYLDFLSRLLPECALIFLTRDHEEVVGSGWWRGRNPAALKERLTFFENVLAAYAQDRPWVFQIDYADLTGRSGRLRAMFDFLGAPYSEERVEAVLSRRHSFRSAPGKAQKPLEDWSDSEHPAIAVDTVLEIRDSDRPKHRVLTVRIEASTSVEVPTLLNLTVRDPKGTQEIDWSTHPSEARNDALAQYSGGQQVISRTNRLSSGQSCAVYLADSEENDFCLASLAIGI